MIRSWGFKKRFKINICLDKRTGIMKKTQFKVEDVFDDILGKESILPEQITKNFFLAKMM